MNTLHGCRDKTGISLPAGGFRCEQPRQGGREFREPPLQDRYLLRVEPTKH